MFFWADRALQEEELLVYQGESENEYTFSKQGMID